MCLFWEKVLVMGKAFKAFGVDVLGVDKVDMV